LAAALNSTLGAMKAATTLLLALKLVVSATFIGSSCCRAAAVQSDQISLAGQWRFQLDRSNTGIGEQWFERSLPDKIRLPGSLPAQGIGDDVWTGRQTPTTLGILCGPKHPALASFPTEFHSNWQWWYLISQAGAMILDDLPKELRPTVQVIDDWVTSRKLGLVFEARMGAGSLLVCSIDLHKDLEHNPVARQMLHSLLHYMDSSRFKPKVTVAPAQVRSLIVPP
jgi:hypothetical protein